MDNIWIYIIIYDISENIYIILYQYLSNICKHFWRKFEISQEQSLTRFVSWPRANHVSCTAKGPSWCPKAAGTLWGASRKGPRFSESLTMSYLNGLVEEKQGHHNFMPPFYEFRGITGTKKVNASLKSSDQLGYLKPSPMAEKQYMNSLSSLS